MIPSSTSIRQISSHHAVDGVYNDSSSIQRDVEVQSTSIRPSIYVVRTQQIATEVLTISAHKLIESCRKNISVQTIAEATDDLTTSASQSKAKTPKDLTKAGSRFNWYARWINPTGKLQTSLGDAKVKTLSTELTKQDVEQLVKITKSVKWQSLGIVFSGMVYKIDDRKHVTMALKCLYYLAKNRIDITHQGVESIIEALRYNMKFLMTFDGGEMRWYNPLNVIHTSVKFLIAVKSLVWQILILSHAIQYIDYQWPNDIGELIDDGLNLMRGSEKYFLETIVIVIAAKAKLRGELTSLDLLTIKKALQEIVKGKDHLLYQPEVHRSGKGKQWGWSTLLDKGIVSDLFDLVLEEKFLSEEDSKELLAIYNRKSDPGIRSKILRTLRLAAQNGQWNFQNRDEWIKILKIALSNDDYRIKNDSLVIASTLAINCLQSAQKLSQEFTAARYQQQKWALRALKDYIILRDQAQTIATDLAWKELFIAIKNDTNRSESLRSEAQYLHYLIEPRPEHIEVLLSDDQNQSIATKHYLTLAEKKQQINSEVVNKLFGILKIEDKEPRTLINIIMTFRYLLDIQEISEEIPLFVASFLSSDRCNDIKLKKSSLRLLSAAISKNKKVEQFISEALIKSMEQSLREAELFRETVSFVNRFFVEDLDVKHPNGLLQGLINSLAINLSSATCYDDTQRYHCITVLVNSAFRGYAVSSELHREFIERVKESSNLNTKQLLVQLFFILIEGGQIVDWDKAIFDFLIEQSCSHHEQGEIIEDLEEANFNSTDSMIVPFEFALGTLCAYIEVVADQIPLETIGDLFNLSEDDNGELAILHAFKVLAEKKVVLENEILCRLSQLLVKTRNEYQPGFAELLDDIRKYHTLPQEAINDVLEAMGSENQAVLMICLDILNIDEIELNIGNSETLENSVYYLFKLMEKDYLSLEIRLKGLTLLYRYSCKGVCFPEHLTKLALLSEAVETMIQKKSLQILTSQIRLLKTVVDLDFCFSIKESIYPLLKVEELQGETIRLWYELGQIYASQDHASQDRFFSLLQLDTLAETAYSEQSRHTLKVTRKLLELFPGKLSVNTQNLLGMIRISMNLGNKKFTIFDDIQALKFLLKQVEKGPEIFPNHYQAIEKAIIRFNHYHSAREDSESVEVDKDAKTEEAFLETLFSFYGKLVEEKGLPLEGIVVKISEIPENILKENDLLSRSRLIAKTVNNHYSITDEAVKILEEGFIREMTEEWDILYLNAMVILFNRNIFLSTKTIEKVWEILISTSFEMVKQYSVEMIVKHLKIGGGVEIFGENPLDLVFRLKKDSDSSLLQKHYQMLIAVLRKRLKLHPDELEVIYQEIFSIDLFVEQWEKCQIFKENCLKYHTEVYNESHRFEINKYLLVVNLKEEERKFLQDLENMIEDKSFVKINEKINPLIKATTLLIDVDSGSFEIDFSESNDLEAESFRPKRYFSQELFLLLEKSLQYCSESEKQHLLDCLEKINHRMPLTGGILSHLIGKNWMDYTPRVFTILRHYISRRGGLTDVLIEDLKTIILEDRNPRRNFYAYLCLKQYQRLPIQKLTKDISRLIELECYPIREEVLGDHEINLDELFQIVSAEPSSSIENRLDINWLHRLNQHGLEGGGLSVKNSEILLHSLERFETIIDSISLIDQIELSGKVRMALEIFDRMISTLPISMTERLYRGCFNLFQHDECDGVYLSVASKILTCNKLSPSTAIRCYEILSQQLIKVARISSDQLVFLEMLVKYLGISIDQSLLLKLMNLSLKTYDSQLAIKAILFLHNQLIIASVWPIELLRVMHQTILTFFPDQESLEIVESERPSLFSRVISIFRSNQLEIPPTYHSIRAVMRNLLSYVVENSRSIEFFISTQFNDVDKSNQGFINRFLELHSDLEKSVKIELRQLLENLSSRDGFKKWMHVFILKQREFNLIGQDLIDFISMSAYCSEIPKTSPYYLDVSNRWLKSPQEVKTIFFGCLFSPFLMSNEQQQELCGIIERLEWGIEFNKKFFRVFSRDKLTTAESLMDLFAFIRDEEIEKSLISSYLKDCHEGSVNPEVFKKKLLKALLSESLISLRDGNLGGSYIDSLVANSFSLVQNGWSCSELRQWFKNVASMIGSQKVASHLEELDELFAFLSSYQRLMDETEFYRLSKVKRMKLSLLVESLYEQILKKYLTPNNRERDLKELFEELQTNEINQKDELLFNLLKDDILKDIFISTEELCSKNKGDLKLIKRKVISANVSTFRIKDWIQEDVEAWSRDLKRLILEKNLVEKELLPECLAVFKRACYLSFNYEPRTVQLLAVVILTDRADPGIIAQIATGEGKSLIIAMLAVLKGLQGKYVDVITSSSDLAERDVKKFETFYNLFGLSVATNKDINYQTGPKNCYQKRIVYGNPSDFEFDILRQEYCLLRTREVENGKQRGYEFVILDEVDNVLVEGNDRLTMISTPLPLMQELTPFFLMIWTELKNLLQLFETDQDGNIGWLEPKSDLEQVEFEEEELRLEFNTDLAEISHIDPKNSVELENFVCKKLSSYVEKLIFGEKTAICVPTHLKEFIASQADIWIKNAWLASEVYKEGVQYTIKKDREKGDIIVPVDFENTGSLLMNTTLGDALHQFLQIKHSLNVEPFSIVTNYLSTYASIQRYDRKIGITGTIGSNSLQKLFKTMYEFSSIQIPSFLLTTREVLTPILRENENEWLEAIIHSIVRESSLGKVVLIICETIKAADMIESILSEKLENDLKILKYIDDTVDNKTVFNGKIGKGKVVVATNLAGRGFDIALDEGVVHRGGLHVIVSFLPQNSRIQEQAFGRASRRGEPGTAQLILNKEAIDQVIHLTSEEKEELLIHPPHILAIRDRRENDKLWVIENTQLPKIIKQTELFGEYLQLLREVQAIEEMGGNKSISEKIKKHIYSDRKANSFFLQEKILARRSALEEKWGLWLKNIQCQEAIDDNTMIDFRIFKAGILEMLHTDRFITNPVHYISLGNALLNKASNYSEIFTKKYLLKHALDAYQKAINLDPIFSYNAYYHKVFTLLSLKENDCLEQARLTLLEMNRAIEGPYEQLRMAIVYFENANLFHSDVDRSKKKRANMIEKLNEVLQVYRILIEAAELNAQQIERLLKFVEVKSSVPSLSQIPDRRNTLSQFRTNLLQELKMCWDEQKRRNHDARKMKHSSGFIKIEFRGLKTFTNDIKTKSELITAVEGLKADVKVGLTFDSRSLYSERGVKEGLRALLPINKNGLKVDGISTQGRVDQAKSSSIPLQSTSIPSYSQQSSRGRKGWKISSRQLKSTFKRIEDLQVKVSFSDLGLEKFNDILKTIPEQSLIRISIGPLKLNGEILSAIRTKNHSLKVSVWCPSQSDLHPKILSIDDPSLDNQDLEITLFDLTKKGIFDLIEDFSAVVENISLILSYVNQTFADQLLKDQTLSSTLHFEDLSKELAIELLKATKDEHDGATLSFDFIEFNHLEKVINGLSENNLFHLNHRLISADLAEINHSRSFIDHYRVNGYHYLFSIGEDLPCPKAGIAFLVTISVAQVAAGIALTTFSGGLLVQVGGGLVSEGIGDATRIFNGIVNNEFHLDQYLKEKAVSVGISLTCAGFSQITKIKEFVDKGGKVVNVAMDHGDEVVQALSRSRKAITSVGKVTIQVTKNAIKTVGSEAIDSGGSLLISKFVDTLAVQIEKMLIGLFNKRIWDDQLRIIFGADEFLQSDHRRVEIKNTIQALLLDGSKSTVYTNVLETDELVRFEREFAQSIQKQFEQSRDFRPLLFEKVRELFLAKKEYDKVCGWLVRKGVLNGDGVIDPLSFDQFLKLELDNTQKRRFYGDVSSYDLKKFTCSKKSEVRKAILQACLGYLQKIKKDYSYEKQKFINQMKILLKQMSSERLQSQFNVVSGCCKQIVEMAADGVADHACDKLDERSRSSALGKKNKPSKKQKIKKTEEKGKAKAKQSSKKQTKSSKLSEKKQSLKDKKIKSIEIKSSTSSSKVKDLQRDSPKKQTDESSQGISKKREILKGVVKTAGSSTNQHLRNRSIHQTSHQHRSGSLFLENMRLLQRKKNAENYASAMRSHAQGIKRDIGFILIKGGVVDENQRMEEVLNLFQLSLTEDHQGRRHIPERILEIVKTYSAAAEDLESLKRGLEAYKEDETKKLKNLKKSLALGDPSDFIDSVSKLLNEGAIIELGRTTHRLSRNCEQTMLGIFIEGVGEFGQNQLENEARKERGKLLLKLVAGVLLKESIDHFSALQSSHLAVQSKSGEFTERAVATQTEIARQIVANYKGFLNRILDVGFNQNADYEEEIQEITADFEARKGELNIESNSHVENARAFAIDREIIQQTNEAGRKLVGQFVKIMKELCSKTDEELEKRFPELLSELESLSLRGDIDRLDSEDVRESIQLPYDENNSSSSDESSDDFEFLEIENVGILPFARDKEVVEKLFQRSSPSLTAIRRRVSNSTSLVTSSSSSQMMREHQAMTLEGAGLVNRGNDCFFNATIQLLLNSDLKDFFLNPEYLTCQANASQQLGENEAEDCEQAFRFLNDLNETYQQASSSGKVAEYNHETLRRVLQLDGNNFRSITQHDCHEAFAQLCRYYDLESINSEFNHIRRINLSKKTQVRSIPKSDTTTLKNYSKVNAEGVITWLEKTSLQLIHLEKDCNSMERLVDKIFVEKEVQGEYKFLLDSETNPEEWDLYFTQAFTEKIDRNNLILKDHLMLHVQRFVGEGADFRKDETDLPADLFEISLGIPQVRYELIGFVVHRGESREYGHYVAFIETPEGWIEWDDSRSKTYSNIRFPSSSSSSPSCSSSSSEPKSIYHNNIHRDVVKNARSAYLLHYKRL